MPMYLRSSFIKEELRGRRRQDRLIDFDQQGLAVFPGKREIMYLRSSFIKIELRGSIRSSFIKEELRRNRRQQ